LGEIQGFPAIFSWTVLAGWNYHNRGWILVLGYHDRRDIEIFCHITYYIHGEYMEELITDESMPEELTETGEKSGIQQEDNTEMPQEPFNPKEISIDSKKISLDQVLRRLKSKTIRLSPDFQRNVVWNNTRKSLLIESLMLNIPIAMFYVSDDGKGNWDVVDGLQRLTAIKEFIYDKTLILEGLEFWKDYNDLKFDDLPSIPYNQIMETEFNFVIINPGTPESVKYNIFKRINTGGLPLSGQEIRHALFQGKGTVLLVKLSETKEFKAATDNSINDSRMAAREIILRCLSFLLLGNSNYPNTVNMENFLRKGLKILNNLESISDVKLGKDFEKDDLSKITIRNYEKLKKYFLLGMERSFELFEKNAFRISLLGKHRSPVNKALFETWGCQLALLSQNEYTKCLKNKNNLFLRYESKKADLRFYRAVSRDAWKKPNVDYRFYEISNIIREAINADKN
jgi:hypothetical protein